MIFEAQRYSYIFSDRVYSLAVGALAGFFHRLLSLFLSKGKVRVFIKDFATAFVFSLFLYSYVISFANYRVLRWYNVLFRLAGLVLFNPVLLPWLDALINLFKVTAVYFLKKIKNGLYNKIKKEIGGKIKKYQKFPKENQPQLLQEADKVLYN